MAGAAAILYEQNKPVPNASLRHQLGPLTEHTTFDAEGVGIMLGIHLIKQYVEDPNDKECLICLDGRSAIEALENRQPKSGQNIVEATLQAAKKLAREEKTEKLTTVMWIPGHCGVAGNEAVDKEAKRAAKASAKSEMYNPRGATRIIPNYTELGLYCHVLSQGGMHKCNTQLYHNIHINTIL
ncbi:hypothetical protein DFH05DRAFT_1408498 [Lentinula detonsa]|uniref:RNase H type-1 domain-containing protein n=1 Tax=Lentinula detonsa TaxID=2804962 RepID=A0A9W8NQ80_9AGAR|nr:hypothetical protein DFH05DRAFT_1408498 [Lentinula detonsa]